MSGSISQPMPQRGSLPPQVLAMLLQAAQRQGQGPMQPVVGGPAQAQMPQAPMRPMASPVMAPQQMPPQQQMPPPQIGIPGPMPGGMSNSYPAMAQRGRNGDSMLAHMTPGEIAVPPQVQSPQLIAALQRAFKDAGADVRQFAAGSPFAAHNPDTGQQEFSLWSALLPVAGAVVGSVVPGIGTAAGAALGGAAGGAAGGLIDHQGALGTLLSAAGGGAGGYLGAGGGLSGLLGSGSGAVGAAGAGTGAGTLGSATSGAATSAPLGDAAQSAMATRMAAGDTPAMIGAGTFPQAAPAAATSPSLMSMAKTGMGAGMGAGIGGSLAPPPNSGSNTPPGFNQPMGAVNPNAMIGGRPAVSAPNFAGYNPYTSVTAGSPYRFY